MPGAPVLLMIAVMALAAFISFAAPTRLRARLRLRDWDSEAPQKSLMAARVDPAADGLRDTAMMLELVASMLDAGAGIRRALELIAQVCVTTNQAITPAGCCRTCPWRRLGDCLADSYQASG